MKVFFVGALCSLLHLAANAQSTNNEKAAADAAVNAFTWDVQKEARGSLMFLDVPYQRDNSDSVEYLTLTVAKDKAKQRPAFISVIVPGNVVQANGIFITFARSVNKGNQLSMELQKEKPVQVNFESCTAEICKARMIDGFAIHDNGQKEDVLQKFMTFDHVLFLFIYPDGGHKSVAVPLFSFKQQYKKLL